MGSGTDPKKKQTNREEIIIKYPLQKIFNKKKTDTHHTNPHTQIKMKMFSVHSVHIFNINCIGNGWSRYSLVMP